MPVHKIILIVSVLFSSSAFSSDGLWSKDIDTLLEKNGLSKDQYGIEIRSADSTQNYYSANSKQPFNPASTMKIWFQSLHSSNWDRTTNLPRF
jgi:D-alanyl-D-alanine carboxypeptidase